MELYGFNSRTPGGVRLSESKVLGTTYWFQFTHPGRGATRSVAFQSALSSRFQFTHPGRGATPCAVRRLTAEGQFQFTHPGRGATYCVRVFDLGQRRFNSRTPGGVRRLHYCPNGGQVRFNSRTPGGVRLRFSGALVCRPHVSIHAPREGCDT